MGGEAAENWGPSLQGAQGTRGIGWKGQLAITERGRGYTAVPTQSRGQQPRAQGTVAMGWVRRGCTSHLAGSVLAECAGGSLSFQSLLW